MGAPTIAAGKTAGIDDLGFHVAGGHIGLPQQVQHTGKTGLVLQMGQGMGDDDVPHHGDGESVIHAAGQLDVIRLGCRARGSQQCGQQHRRTDPVMFVRLHFAFLPNRMMAIPATSRTRPLLYSSKRDRPSRPPPGTAKVSPDKPMQTRAAIPDDD